MKNFTIKTTEKNVSWVKENLTENDYRINFLTKKITVFYNHEFQKADILKVIE